MTTLTTLDDVQRVYDARSIRLNTCLFNSEYVQLNNRVYRRRAFDQTLVYYIDTNAPLLLTIEICDPLDCYLWAVIQFSALKGYYRVYGGEGYHEIRLNSPTGVDMMVKCFANMFGPNSATRMQPTSLMRLFRLLASTRPTGPNTPTV